MMNPFITVVTTNSFVSAKPSGLKRVKPERTEEISFMASSISTIRSVIKGSPTCVINLSAHWSLGRRCLTLDLRLFTFEIEISENFNKFETNWRHIKLTSTASVHTSWNHLEQAGRSWNHLKRAGTSRNHLERAGTSSNQLVRAKTSTTKTDSS